MRRLSHIGGASTGWRSDLETHGPRQNLGTFLVGSLIAVAVFVGIVLLLVALAD